MGYDEIRKGALPMSQLMNIHDATKYFGVSLRTLRYYEDVGLLTSIRESSTTFRSYDGIQLHRLEQILMLRKLNFSIKEIKQIFDGNDSEFLLTLLQKKLDTIDVEITNLSQIKAVLSSFLQHLSTMKLVDQLDIKLLIDQVTDFKQQLENDPTIHKKINYTVVSKMSSIPDVRIISLPKCKMVSSGLGNFCDENFEKFDQWFSSFPVSFVDMPKDFLWYDKERSNLVWWYLYSEGMDTSDFPIDEFDGGLFACAVSKDGDDEDGERVYAGICKWIEDSNRFQIDERPNHYTMSHIITSPDLKNLLSYEQLEILVPIKPISE